MKGVMKNELMQVSNLIDKNKIFIKKKRLPINQ